MHFQPFQVHKMKMNQKVEQKVERWNVNFQKWKGIWIYNKSLNWFTFQKKAVVMKDKIFKKEKKKKGHEIKEKKTKA